jgi:hypothetical protein
MEHRDWTNKGAAGPQRFELAWQKVRNIWWKKKEVALSFEDVCVTHRTHIFFASTRLAPKENPRAQRSDE